MQRTLTFVAGRKTVGYRYGRDLRQDGQSAVPCWLAVGVVYCCAPCAQVHAGKRNFIPVSRATGRTYLPEMTVKVKI